MPVHRFEEGAGCFGPVRIIGDERERTGKIGILHGHTRDVAVVQVLQRGDRRRVHPAGAGGCDEHEQ